MAVYRGYIKTAAEYYPELLNWRANIANIHIGSTRFRMLGILETAIENLDEALKHFEEGYDFSKKAGYLPELAWTCCDWSDALIKRGKSGDKEKAKELLEEGLALAEKLTMKALKERITERFDKLRGVRPAYPDGLTEREVDVLKLIASGKTNQEIADELCISEKTVTRHITHIFSKTHTGNRTLAARYAINKGLAETEELV